MDYESVITPGAKCTECDHHKEIIQTSIGPIVRCGLYGVFNENYQAEHCINHYVPKKQSEDGKPE